MYCPRKSQRNSERWDFHKLTALSFRQTVIARSKTAHELSTAADMLALVVAYAIGHLGFGTLCRSALSHALHVRIGQDEVSESNGKIGNRATSWEKWTEFGSCLSKKKTWARYKLHASDRHTLIGGNYQVREGKRKQGSRQLSSPPTQPPHALSMHPSRTKSVGVFVHSRVGSRDNPRYWLDCILRYAAIRKYSSLPHVGAAYIFRPKSEIMLNPNGQVCQLPT